MSGCGIIPLTQGKIALVDAEDYERVSQFKWYAAKQRPACGKPVFYAKRTDCTGDKPKTIWLHRFVLNVPDGLEADHIDGNRTLDCRRNNLRVATKTQNTANRRKQTNTTSRYKGVNLSHGRWMSRIRVGGQVLFLGCYSNEEDAARAYNAAATKHCGAFAHLNNVGAGPGEENRGHRWIPKRKTLKPTSSIYRGVHWDKHTKKWVAQTKKNRKCVFLGRFATEEEAARVYNTAATLHFGEFALLNVILPTP